MSNVTVDPNICIGCGMCTSLSPEVFEMNAEGKAQVFTWKENSEYTSVNDAAAACPVQAIAII